MTIVTEAKGVLHNGTSAVLSAVQRRRKTTRRLAGINPEKLMKQVTRRFEAGRTRRVPVIPIAIAAGATAVGVVVGTIVLRRYLATGYANEEAIPVAEEFISANEHVEVLEPTLAEH